jgi:hypothetical protein
MKDTVTASAAVLIWVCHAGCWHTWAYLFQYTLMSSLISGDDQSCPGSTSTDANVSTAASFYVLSTVKLRQLCIHSRCLHLFWSIDSRTHICGFTRCSLLQAGSNIIVWVLLLVWESSRHPGFCLSYCWRATTDVALLAIPIEVSVPPFSILHNIVIHSGICLWAYVNSMQQKQSTCQTEKRADNSILVAKTLLTASDVTIMHTSATMHCWYTPWLKHQQCFIMSISIQQPTTSKRSNVGCPYLTRHISYSNSM